METIFGKDTPLGKVWVAEEEGVLTRLSLGAEPPSRGLPIQRTALADRAFEELEEYLAGGRRAFDLPLGPRGTEFQRRVWAALVEIPYGQTQSYGQVAQAVGNPRACRAAGGAIHCNPLAILIPCHRVIGAQGTLTGYAYGLALKRQLLALEGVPLR